MVHACNSRRISVHFRAASYLERLCLKKPKQLSITYVCACVWAVQQPVEARVVDPSGAGVAGSFKMPHVGVKRTWVLCKNSMSS